MFAEVIFPLKLKSFTYSAPPDTPLDLTGRIVKAPLGNRNLYGIVCDVSDTCAFVGRATDKNIGHKLSKIKEIVSVHEHFGSSLTVPLLKWLSEYYIAPSGVALASCFFKETINIIEKSIVHNVSASEDCRPEISSLSDNAEQDIFLLLNAIQSGNFSSFLLHSPSYFYEKSFLNDFCKKAFTAISGAIVLVPEISQIESIARILQAIFGERVCTIHSKQGRKRRTETMRGVLSGHYNIVVGTRSAILMPLKKISFIAVLNEHSPSYKGEEGLRYNGRDVAVMRGFLERAPVLLSSICPSVESIYNSETGKYHQLRVSHALSGIPSNLFSSFSAKNRPEIEIINMRDAQKSGLSISKRVLTAAGECPSSKENLLFIVNKKGYSLIMCGDCGYIFRCPACQMPLMFYKSEGLLRCRRCGKERTIPESCQVCRGVELMPLGAGTERIKEDINKFLKKDAVLLEKNIQSPPNNDEFTSFVIGHGNQARKLKGSMFKSAVFFDIDIGLLEPNYRANERVFQNVMQIAQIVKPNGRIFLQTRNPRNKILNFIKNYDFKGFYKNELAMRKETDFPPFSRLILFNILLKEGVNGLKKEVERLFSEKYALEIEILGPIELPSTIKLHLHWQVLIKSKDRKKLHQLASSLKETLSAIKGLKVNTDVDPIRL